MSPDKLKPARPNMLPVKSSNISELGWNPETGELHVRFASGGLFSYADVPQADYEALRTAKSVGSHFARAIRPKFKATAL
jgi:hypothetical protein